MIILVNDSKPVDISQVDGVAKFIVPYVGYPSVWFSQFVLNKQPVVETEWFLYKKG